MVSNVARGMEEIEQYAKLTNMKQEMHHAYMYLVTSRMAQLCPLGEYRADMELFFGHDVSRDDVLSRSNLLFITTAHC